MVELIQRTPPTEFTEKLDNIQMVLNEVFPTISVDFQYAEVAHMQELEEDLKVGGGGVYYFEVKIWR